MQQCTLILSSSHIHLQWQVQFFRCLPSNYQNWICTFMLPEHHPNCKPPCLSHEKAETQILLLQATTCGIYLLRMTNLFGTVSCATKSKERENNKTHQRTDMKTKQQNMFDHSICLLADNFCTERSAAAESTVITGSRCGDSRTTSSNGNASQRLQGRLQATLISDNSSRHICKALNHVNKTVLSMEIGKHNAYQ